MAKQEALSFMEFKNKFNSEDACREHLFKMRWQDGFKCPNVVTRPITLFQQETTMNAPLATTKHPSL